MKSVYLFVLVGFFAVSFSQGDTRVLALPPVCQLPVDTGPCDMVVPRYFFNVSSAQCEPFNYGGCEGNGNNFETLEQCQDTCIESTKFECPEVECKMECAGGYEKDDKGCKKCRCLSPRVRRSDDPDAHVCPLIEPACEPCPDNQEHGKDENGCDSCVCVEKQVVEPDCPPLCNKFCEHGFQKDESGCSICTCVEPPSAEDTPTETPPTETPPTETPPVKESCPLLTDCSLDCADGLQKDEHGCTLCECNGEAEYVRPEEEDKTEEVEAEACTPLVSCNIACPEGQLKDSKGCPICKCAELAIEPEVGAEEEDKTEDEAEACTPLVSCNIACPEGQLKDSKGCPICKCAELAIEPEVGAEGQNKTEQTDPCSPLVSCNIACPDGHRKDSRGCPICKCAQLEVEPPEEHCPPLLTCKISCPEGQAKDSRGCPLCQCVVAPATPCPPVEVSCTMACQFGFAKNADGCQTCQCQPNPCEVSECTTGNTCVAEENSAGEFEARCIASPETLPQFCLDAFEVGRCRALIERFFYNATSGRCQTFGFGGCGGNRNNFETQELCQSTCRAGVCSTINCLMECSSGFEIDQQGCKMCKCKSAIPDAPAPTPVPCPLMKCVPCPGDEYKNDSNGCRTCECVQPRTQEGGSAVCPDPAIACTIYCAHGQQKDSRGCTICKCVDVEESEVGTNCSTLKSCKMHCPNGNVKDSRGCPICKCIEPEAGTNCSLSKTCKMNCANGFVKNSQGCPICKCIEAAPKADECPLLVACRIYCSGGQEKDSRGCPICKCIDPKPEPEVGTNCSLSKTCKMHCPHGNVKDSRGCPICKCIEPSHCPAVGSSCALFCSYGFARDSKGCSICQCQQDPCETLECSEEETCMTQPNDNGDQIAKCVPGRRWCSNAMCMLHCENGFKHDKLGCPTCSCLNNRLDKCSNISWCKKYCEFGQQREEHGCRTCDCLPNPCTDKECGSSEVCEAFTFKGCPTCPAVARCIDKTDVRRLYITLAFRHGIVRNLDTEEFAKLVIKALAEAMEVNGSAISNVSILTLTSLKTVVRFHIVSSKIDLLIAARRLINILDGELVLVTFDLNRVTFEPDSQSLTVQYSSNPEVESYPEAKAVESSGDSKVIAASCLIGLAFFVICAIIMFVLYRRRRRQHKSNVIYKKAPTGEEKI